MDGGGAGGLAKVAEPENADEPVLFSVSVTLVGSAGTKTVAGNVFVAVFNAGRPSGDPMMASSLLDVAPIP